MSGREREVHEYELFGLGKELILSSHLKKQKIVYNMLMGLGDKSIVDLVFYVYHCVDVIQLNCNTREQFYSDYYLLIGYAVIHVDSFIPIISY